MTMKLSRRLVAAALPASFALAPAARAADGLIERRESRYNTIYISRQGPYIAMQFGVNQALFTENLYDPTRPNFLPMAYTRDMTLALAYAKGRSSLLEIGLGGGRTAVYLRDHVPELQLTCVELDPDVVDMARKHFDIEAGPRLDLVVRDGRIFLTQNKSRYDVIFVDAYRGTFIPFHLTTRQFYQLAKRRLKPGGALAQNISPGVALTDAMIATLKAVFDNVDTYASSGNYVTIAYDGPAFSAAALMERAQALQAAHNFPHAMPELLAARRVVTRAEGQVLTDDFAPVEALRGIERHNEKRT